ncbi:DUF3592 domain-containing protein [Kitasatospora sp. NPDC088346]|uniref:DUF3592 domain-containing protein n=1 Tax=Kitasatospora sp. NPDC088346 TaxID=3364073 RepID=UPI003806AD25
MDVSTIGLFLVVLLVTAGLPLVMLTRMIRRVQLARLTVRQGLQAQGRLIQVASTLRVTPHGGQTSRSCVVEFATADGQAVRFAEPASATAIEGDVVTVYYLPECPERATTVTAQWGTGNLQLGFIAVVCCLLVGFLAAAEASVFGVL